MNTIFSLSHKAKKTLINAVIFNNQCVLKKRVKIVKFFNYIHSDQGHVV